MKTIKKTLLTLMILTCLTATINAQGWIQDKKAMYSLGFGVTQVIFLPANYYPLSHRGTIGLSLNVSGEYKVHRVISLGWQTGVDMFANGRYYNKHDDFYYNSTIIGLPIGFKINFHFLEAANAKLKDKLDVYAGFNGGGGPAFYTYPHGGVHAFAYGGAQVGIRYWFEKIAIFGELGWGENIANFGITFR